MVPPGSWRAQAARGKPEERTEGGTSLAAAPFPTETRRTHAPFPQDSPDDPGCRRDISRRRPRGLRGLHRNDFQHRELDCLRYGHHLRQQPVGDGHVRADQHGARLDHAALHPRHVHGSLPSTVRLYRSAVTNGNAFNVTVERGSGLSGAYPSCTGFTAASTVYTGTLGALPTTYATAPDARGSAWNQNDAVDYRFTITVVDDPTPNARATTVSSGAHSFTWEAQNN